jgi:hypothetical protein
MTSKDGNIVSHASAMQWGAGKVLEVTASMASIQFSDGKSRKIAASRFITLQPTATASHIPPEPALVVKATHLKNARKKTALPAKGA